MNSGGFFLALSTLVKSRNTKYSSGSTCRYLSLNPKLSLRRSMKSLTEMWSWKRLWTSAIFRRPL